jgi:hypothetical protein
LFNGGGTTLRSFPRLYSLSCAFDQFEQGGHFLFRALIVPAFPLVFAQDRFQKGLNRKAVLPAQDGSLAWERASFLPAIGECDLPTEPGTADLQVIVHGVSSFNHFGVPDFMVWETLQ